MTIVMIMTIIMIMIMTITMTMTITITTTDYFFFNFVVTFFLLPMLKLPGAAGLAAAPKNCPPPALVDPNDDNDTGSCPIEPNDTGG